MGSSGEEKKHLVSLLKRYNLACSGENAERKKGESVWLPGTTA